MLLALSAQDYIPHSIYEGFPQPAAQKLFAGVGMRLYNGPYGLYAPLEIIEDFKQFEPISQQAFKDAVKPGMTIVDVGANIGYYTLLAGKLSGASGRVNAVEPCPGNLAFLERNIKLSKLKNITIHPYAAGETFQKREFHVTDISVDHGFYAHPYATTVNMIEVTQLPLDELIKSRVDLAKIDVEGAEIEVLNGMKSIVNRSGSLVLFDEWSPDFMRSAGREPSELFDRLRALGFQHIDVLDDLGRKVTTVDDVLERLRLGHGQILGSNSFASSIETLPI
jgi:FkbM family methyltransferase